MRPVRIFLHASVCWGALELLLRDDGLQLTAEDEWLTEKSTRILWPGGFLHSRCPSTFVESWRLESLAHWPLTTLQYHWHWNIYRNPEVLPHQKRGTNRTARQRPAFASMRLPCHTSWVKSHLSFGNSMTFQDQTDWAFFRLPAAVVFLVRGALREDFGSASAASFFSQVLRTMENKCIQTPSDEYCAAHVVGKVVLTSACHHTPCHLALPPLALLAHLRDPLSNGEWQAHQPARTLRDSMSSSSATSEGTMSSSKMFPKEYEKSLWLMSLVSGDTKAQTRILWCWIMSHSDSQ